jgi:N-acetylglucosaminyl-diphospho-decaprenol L-rhamnosyltransferase
VTSNGDRVAVLIVGFRNAGDVRECVAALARCNPQNFDIFVCENGGHAAFRALCESLDRDGCILDHECSLDAFLYAQARAEKRFNGLVSYRLRDTDITLIVSEAAENLGYAGGVNSWLRLILEQPGYAGFWILNPDTLVEPDALSEMVKYARSSGKGMVGSRIVPASDPSLVHCRGLRWRPIRASTEAIDYHALASREPDTEKIEKLLDAPSGASFYVTRECVERIGLMNEWYFLFFEDLDWGTRAKKECGLGYADHSIVRHHGGTTIGSAGKRSEKSNLTVFLEFRNRILFVRDRYPAWFLWTIFVLIFRALEYSTVGSFENTKMAYRGIAAGLAGQIGRPDQLLELHVLPNRNREVGE